MAYIRGRQVSEIITDMDHSKNQQYVQQKDTEMNFDLFISDLPPMRVEFRLGETSPALLDETGENLSKLIPH